MAVVRQRVTGGTHRVTPEMLSDPSSLWRRNANTNQTQLRLKILIIGFLLRDTRHIKASSFGKSYKVPSHNSQHILAYSLDACD